MAAYETCVKSENSKSNEQHVFRVDIGMRRLNSVED